MKLKFLGTGGGRYVTAAQRRKTAGILLRTEETQVHVDPGPGALVYAQEEKPEETEAVLCSHAHLDHCNDAEAIIEMMTELHDHPGTVFANESCLRGYSDVEKSISDYHQNLCLNVNQLEECAEFEFKDLEIRSQEMFHGDPKTQGFTVEDDEHKIGFWTDTEFSEELLEFYDGCDIMVIYCTRPRNKPIKGHTTISDVPKIVEEVEPNTVIISHFGYAMLESDLEEEEEYLEEELEAKVIFANDGMEFPGDTKLSSFVS